MRRMSDRVRERWERGQVALNAWLTFEGFLAAEAVAGAGFDAVTVDLQHGAVTFDGLGAVVAGIEPTGAVPFARLPWNDPAAAMRALDLGVRGVIAPMVNSAEEAGALARACRYPPRGIRSYGTVRAAFGAAREQTERANDEILVFAQIETADGLAAVADICAVDGLDGLYVGPADLSLSLGLSSFADLEDPKLLQALDAILEAARLHGVVPGIHAPSENAALAMARRGFTFVGSAGDANVLSTALAGSTERIRAELEPPA
jgi:4-hydroxy-2-oxoheptanedioate aldolase